MDENKRKSTAKINRNTLKWLWRVTGKYKGGVAALFAIQVTFGICGVASAMLFRALIDCAVGGERTGFFRMALL